MDAFLSFVCQRTAFICDFVELFFLLLPPLSFLVSLALRSSSFSPSISSLRFLPLVLSLPPPLSPFFPPPSISSLYPLHALIPQQAKLLLSSPFFSLFFPCLFFPNPFVLQPAQPQFFLSYLHHSDFLSSLNPLPRLPPQNKYCSKNYFSEKSLARSPSFQNPNKR